MPVPPDYYHSPAKIVQRLLIAWGVGVDLPADPTLSVENLPDWIVYAHKLRSERTPDNAIAVMNTTPVKDGRYLKTGETAYHYGLQILVRSLEQESGYLKCRRSEEYLSQYATQQTITLNGTTYLIEGFSVTAGTVFVGEEEKSERQFHSVNGKIAFRIQ